MNSVTLALAIPFAIIAAAIVVHDCMGIGDWRDEVAEQRQERPERQRRRRALSSATVHPAPTGWTLVEDIAVEHALLLFRADDSDDLHPLAPRGDRFSARILASDSGLRVAVNGYVIAKAATRQEAVDLAIAEYHRREAKEQRQAQERAEREQRREEYARRLHGQ